MLYENGVHIVRAALRPLRRWAILLIDKDTHSGTNQVKVLKAHVDASTSASWPSFDAHTMATRPQADVTEMNVLDHLRLVTNGFAKAPDIHPFAEKQVQIRTMNSSASLLDRDVIVTTVDHRVGDADLLRCEYVDAVGILRPPFANDVLAAVRHRLLDRKHVLAQKHLNPTQLHVAAMHEANGIQRRVPEHETADMYVVAVVELQEAIGANLGLQVPDVPECMARCPQTARAQKRDIVCIANVQQRPMRSRILGVDTSSQTTGRLPVCAHTFRPSKLLRIPLA